jgi:RimJ/RimL family protein N-acetyltransferase
MLKTADWLRRSSDRITIRVIRPDDRERLVRAFRALDSRSIYLRFFAHKRALSDKELRQMTECDGTRVAALVAAVGNGTEEAIVGLGQYARRGASADIAFAVEEDFQGRGIATRLLRRLVQIARDQGISRFEADVLPENEPMLRVFRRSGLPIKESEEYGAIHPTLALGDAEAPLQASSPKR